MWRHNEHMLMRSTITIEAELRGSMTGLANLLDRVAALRRLAWGSTLVYRVEGNPNTVFEFSAKIASVTYMFEYPSLEARAGSLAMLLSLLAHADGAYEVRFASAYEEVMDVLRQAANNAGRRRTAEANAGALIDRVKALSAANAALAHALAEQQTAGEARRIELHAFAEFCNRVVRNHYAGNLARALADLGLENEQAGKVIFNRIGGQHA